MSVTDQILNQILQSYLNPKQRGEKSYETLSGVQKRLDYMAGSIDLDNSKEVETLIGKIDSLNAAGSFGNAPEIRDHVKNFSLTLASGKKRKSQVLTDRRDLYNLTNPSSIKQLIQQVVTDPTAPNWVKTAQAYIDHNNEGIATIENYIVDLSMARDRLSDKDVLSTALDNRYSNAIAMFDQSLKEQGTDGLSQKEMERILNGTYALQKTADLNFENTKRQYEFAREFESPSLKEKQLLEILETTHKQVKDFDDAMALKDYEYQWLVQAEPHIASDENPDIQKAETDRIEREMFRQVNLIPNHHSTYVKAYNEYQELFKNNPDAMQYANFNDIMDQNIHNELINYVPLNNPNNKSNPSQNKVTFSPGKYGTKQSNEIIYDMLGKGNITFTKDIIDEFGGTWKTANQQVNGLGKPHKDSWKLNKINRADDGSLISIVLDIPNYEKTLPMTRNVGLAPARTYNQPQFKSVTINAEDFIIEDDPNNPHKGFANTMYGPAKYNIYKNLFEY